MVPTRLFKALRHHHGLLLTGMNRIFRKKQDEARLHSRFLPDQD